MPQVTRITRRDSPVFRRFQAVKARKARGFVLVEGPRLLAEALRSGLRVEAVACAGGEPVAWPAGLDPRVERFTLPPALLKALTEVETPQGLVAIVERPAPNEAWLASARFVLLLDGVQDPGNVGTLFRTAEAAGVSGLLLTEGCADPLSAKVIRASAGAVFRLPYASGLPPSEAPRRLPPGMPLLAATVDPREPSLFEAELSLPLALALGSEGQGLSAEVERAATRRARIPVAREVESLNVGVAAGIAMFEISRRAGILTR